jgi:putative transposase
LIAAEQLGRLVGISKACDALNVSRATLYRRRQPEKSQPPRPQPARALSDLECTEVRKELYSDRFVDKSPNQIYAALLDDGVYLCSVRTMYRILKQDSATGERRNQLTRPNYKKPELLATMPNRVWSWDITKLKGPEKWTYYYLYVILDIYSRYTVGWMLAHRESADLATKLITETIETQNVERDQLVLHSDRGPSMASHSVANLLGSLGVTKSHSRPHVSNDNPFSESQFKTMKYQPEFPARFGCYQDASLFCRKFFDWYNNDHYHGSIGYVTPSSLHYGQAPEIIAARKNTLDLAFELRPERFVAGRPVPASLPTAVWINPPPESRNEKRPSEICCPEDPQEAPLTHPRSDYPLAGCVPAEPASVSSDKQKVTQDNTLNTRVMP